MPGPLEAAAAQAGGDNYSEMKMDDATAGNTASPEAEPEPEEEAVMYDGLLKKSFAFWAIMAFLSITGLMSAMEGTIITSALSTINNSLGGGANLYLHIFASL